MSYFESVGMNKEPFSTSPDPAFLYRSAAHNSVLKRLEIGIRLKRGLSVVLGDVGMGKTTLSRALLQEFAHEDDFIFHMIMDPTFNSEFQFLEAIVKMFQIVPAQRTTHDYKEEIEKYLFKKGVDENKTIVLLIDEGQKLSNTFIEVMRVFLNYETNNYKLLQLVIMSQMELLPRIKKIRNFYDRIALKYVINPLDENETREMIEFRLREAGLSRGKKLFSPEALKLIYEWTQGYPRKISIMCHTALEELIIQDKNMVDEDIVRDIIRRESAL